MSAIVAPVKVPGAAKFHTIERLKQAQGKTGEAAVC
jgi:hypothetical protein